MNQSAMSRWLNDFPEAHRRSRRWTWRLCRRDPGSPAWRPFTVIESAALGGVCLNWGCIPSKALLSVVELGDKVKKARSWGCSSKDQSRTISLGWSPEKMR